MSANKSAPLVSVVIPCFNQGKFLGEAIESVLAQTYGQFEIVVIDDGSSDNTWEVAARYPGVACLRQDNQGLAGARNAGLRRSGGEYLVFLDADDRLLPDALKIGVDKLEVNFDCAFVAGNHRVIGVDGSLLDEFPPYLAKKDHYLELLRKNYIAMPAAVMYRRSVFDSVGTFNTSLKACEDYEIYLRITRRWPIHCHDKVVAEYRQHGSNMTRNAPLMRDSVLRVLHSQWPNIEGDARYEEAYRSGIQFFQAYYGGRWTGQKRKRAIVEILKVILCKMQHEQLCGNLEAPQSGDRSLGNMVEIAGWVLGRHLAVIAIEIVGNGRVLQRTTTDIPRPDVAAHYPEIINSDRSGFYARVSVRGIGDKELVVQALLQDNSRVRMARIGVRRRRRSKSSGSTALLSSWLPRAATKLVFLVRRSKES